ncbi:B12-binding domain-containing radical SAM protein [Embleya sp. AB8]|uniref:B12-binding domain-containing radical SAM protein n=1 Tax=Embleya sp. AB8 TaxID=3156304 RepID=UPI003C75B507
MPSEWAGGGDPVDVLLVFPPQTEARFFPYLSLPYLTGHLRRRGRRVHQADLNIGLVHDVLRHPEVLVDAVQARDGGTGTGTGTGVDGWYQRAMAEVVVRHAGDVRARVMHRAPEVSGAPEVAEVADPSGELDALRLARNAVELLVRDTLLARTWPDLGQLDDAVRTAAAAPPGASGVAVERLYRLVVDQLTRHHPRVVGLSVAFFSQLGPALLIAAWVRRLRPEVRICLGGQQVMLRHEALVGLGSVCDVVDALCHTAGEEPLERWLDALDGTAPQADVPGMIWLSRDGDGDGEGKGDGKGDVEGAGAVHRSMAPVRLRFRDLGPPDFAGLPIHAYLSETTQVAIVSCVGCYWGRCAFCSYGNRSLTPGAYQQGTATQLADAVESVVRATGAELLAIADENTNLRLIARAMRLARARGVRVRFDVRARLEHSLVDPQFCHELAELGCAQLSIGYEGTAQRLLDLLDRGVRAADYQRIVDNLADAGITMRLSVMGHVLDETPAEFEASLRFLTDNQAKLGIDALELLVAEPGSRLAQHPERFGLALDTSGPLTGNPELNYLAGRVGYPMAIDGGPARAEALDRLERVFRTVTPGRAGRLSPTRAEPGAGPREAGSVRPHSWVRIVPTHIDDGPEHRITVADLVQERLYALPRRDIEHCADGLLAARTTRGRLLLGRLVGALAGRPERGTVTETDIEYAGRPL